MGLKHSSMNCFLLSDENVRPVTILGLNTEKKGVLSFPFQNLCSPSCTVNTDCLMQILLRLREPLLSLSRSAVNEHIFKDRKLNEPEARTSNHKNMACVFFSPYVKALSISCCSAKFHIALHPKYCSRETTVCPEKTCITA